MTSKMWIASKPVSLGGLDTGYEHSYLVYDPDGNPATGDEQIFRGGPRRGTATGDILIEKWVPLEASEDKLSGLDPFSGRNYTALNLNGKTPEQVKNDVAQWVDALVPGAQDGQEIQTSIPYKIPLLLGSGERIPALNSNTTVRSALEYAGIDFDTNTPRESGIGTRIAPAIFAGAESVYGAGDATVTVNPNTDRIVYDRGGNTAYIVTPNSFDQGKVLIVGDTLAGTLDKIVLNNIDPSDVRFERTLNGDLRIFFPWDGSSDPSILIPGQWKDGVPSINTVWAYPPGGGPAFVIPLNEPDDFPLALPQELPGWVSQAMAPYGAAERAASPLVIDVDGDGIELSGKDGPGAVYWDLDQDGFREASGWIAGGDGLLALDRNGNGAIDAQGELFGTMDTDGFTVLRPLDTNADGKISAAEHNLEIQSMILSGCLSRLDRTAILHYNA